MAYEYSSPIIGQQITSLPPGTPIGRVTQADGQSQKFGPTKAPKPGTSAADAFPTIAHVSGSNGRRADGPGRLVLSNGKTYVLHHNVAVVAVTGEF